MESKIRFLSLNVAMKNNLAGLVDIISEYRTDIIFLQEFRLSKDDLCAKISSLGFSCEVNIDEEETSKPGTAIIWRSSLPVSEVVILEKCRAQVAFMKDYALLNIYTPSGSDKKYER